MTCINGETREITGQDRVVQRRRPQKVRIQTHGPGIQETHRAQQSDKRQKITRDAQQIDKTSQRVEHIFQTNQPNVFGTSAIRRPLRPKKAERDLADEVR
jgi:hypothetical protein